MNITQFLDKHNACKDGRKRAAAFPSLEDAWDTCCPADLIWVATRPGVLTERDLRMFAVFCARSVEHLMRDPRSVAAIDVAERHADGLATDDELRAAASAARSAATHPITPVAAAAHEAAYDAADAAHEAAYDAADAPHEAAHDAAYDAAYNAAAAAAGAAYDAADAAAAAAGAAYDAAYNAARERQAEWIRLNTTPNFS